MVKTTQLIFGLFYLSTFDLRMLVLLLPSVPLHLRLFVVLGKERCSKFPVYYQIDLCVKDFGSACTVATTRTFLPCLNICNRNV